MGRTQRALTSLVAAIPAGFLSYLLVMVFLDQADSLNTKLQIAVGVTLLASVMVTLMPFVLLIPGRKKALDNAGPAAGVASDDDDAVEVMDDDEVSEDVEVEEGASATSDFDLDDSDADVMSDSSDEIDAGNASSLDDMDAFDMDDEEEQPKPKKRKK